MPASSENGRSRPQSESALPTAGVEGNPTLIIWNQFFHNLSQGISSADAAALRDVQLQWGSPLSASELRGIEQDLAAEISLLAAERQRRLQSILNGGREQPPVARYEQAAALASYRPMVHTQFTARFPLPTSLGRHPSLLQRLRDLLARVLLGRGGAEGPPPAAAPTPLPAAVVANRLERSAAELHPRLDAISRDLEHQKRLYASVQAALRAHRQNCAPCQSPGEHAQLVTDVSALNAARRAAGTRAEHASQIGNGELLLGGPVEEREQFDRGLAILTSELRSIEAAIAQVNQCARAVGGAERELAERETAKAEADRQRRWLWFSPAAWHRCQQAEAACQLAKANCYEQHALWRQATVQQEHLEVRRESLSDAIDMLNGARQACLDMEAEERRPPVPTAVRTPTAAELQR